MVQCLKISRFTVMVISHSRTGLEAVLGHVYGNGWSLSDTAFYKRQKTERAVLSHILVIMIEN